MRRSPGECIACTTRSWSQTLRANCAGSSTTAGCRSKANACASTRTAATRAQAGRYAEPLACYERAPAPQPHLAVAHRGRGTALMHLGTAEEAIARFREARRLAPNDDQACNGLGVALERTDRAEEAR